MQITVSDGGEDGRVEWSGGVLSTDYIPSQFCLFQSKAQNVTEQSIRTEILKKKPKPKASKKKTQKKKTKKAQLTSTLSTAIREVLSRKGAYIVFSSKPFTGQKIKKIKEAARDAIKAGGGNPDHLAAIEVYDANKIAEWVNKHHSVALYLTSKSRGRSLSGFQTHESWGKLAGDNQWPVDCRG